jgi:cathepsin L
MKFTLLVVLALVAVACATPFVDETRAVFNNWMQTHSKTYETAEELEHRFGVFLQNMVYVNKHNSEAAQGKHTFTLGMNNLADLTNTEYRAKLLKYKRAVNRTGELFTPLSDAAPPASVDWRTKGVVTPVKDQGQCGSCWSFSAVGAMEGAWATTKGTLVSLSEQNLVDCVQGGSYTCDAGGVMQDAFAYAKNGIEGEADYPYCACSGNQCKFTKSKVRATFSSYKEVGTTETALQAAVAAQPTVSIAIDASSSAFQLYSSGVFNNPSCSSTNLDHGVLAVGYGTLNGQDYWLVKNSWSASWGDSGYIKMSRNKKNQCGVATDASFPLV